MDRKPLPPPFQIGSRVRYVGSRRVYADSDGNRPLLVAGMEFVIDSDHQGKRGTNEQIGWDDIDDVPILDETSDGCCVYTQADGQGRLIRPENAGEWEIVP